MTRETPTHIQIVFGRNMRRLRKQRGWSQMELAFEASMQRAYVGDVENGFRNISIRNIERIAQALGVNPVFLLDDASADEASGPSAERPRRNARANPNKG